MESVSHHTLGAVLAALTLAMPMAVLGAPPTSAAGSCTIIGTSGPDRLVGTAGADFICGRGGNDEMVGRGGNDTFSGGPGRDVVRGGGGNDLMVDIPPVAADTFIGGAGADRFWYLDRTAGVQVTLDGVADDGENGEGDNVMADVESVTGTWDHTDVLIGNASANVLDGGGGDDVLRGGDGNDRLIGNKDVDVLYGEAGDDTLLGGSYNDLLVGGLGADTLDGQKNVPWQSPHPDVCDLDAADASVSRCTPDGSAPDIRLQTNYRAFEPGEQMHVGGLAFDTAGVTGIDLTLVRVSDGTALEICPPRMETGSPKESYRQETNWWWECSLPADMEPGAYLLRSAAYDRLGHRAGLGELGPGDLAFMVLGQVSESVAPEAKLVGVSDTQLVPGERFAMTVAAADPSGAVRINGLFTDAFGSGDWCEPWAAQLISGSILDGTWNVPCEVPSLVRSGDYTASAHVADGWQNTTTTTLSEPQVTVSGGVTDAGPPTVSGVVIAPTGTPREFTVTARVADETGVQFAGFYPWPMPSGEASPCSVFTLRQGTVQDGTWKGRCTVPDHWPAQTYDVVVYASDKLSTYGSSVEGTFTATP